MCSSGEKTALENTEQVEAEAPGIEGGHPGEMWSQKKEGHSQSPGGRERRTQEGPEEGWLEKLKNNIRKEAEDRVSEKQVQLIVLRATAKSVCSRRMERLLWVPEGHKGLTLPTDIQH
jgi:hypothetical protein